MTKRFVLGFSFLIVFSSLARAQFSRYWSESFSTKSALLSGAVVGGYQDESSIYYNPSILSDSSVNQFSFANGVANIDYIRYENALGDDLNIGNLESSVNAGFLSANLYPKDKFQLVWKAAYFNRSKYDNSFKGEVKEEYNVFELTPGLEQYNGLVSSRTEYNDFWYGIGVAKFVNDKLSFGLSAFARYTSLRYHYSKSIEIGALLSDSSDQKIAVNSNQLDNRGYNWRGTLKLGVNYRISENFRAGMTVTSPSFYVVSSVSGSHNYLRVNNLDLSTGSLLPDFFYNASGENMRMNFKDPLSIAVGLDYRLEKLRWNVTAEWFAGLKPYKLIDQSTGEVAILKTTFLPIEEADVLSFVAGGRGIVNVAVGLEIYNENDRSVMLGFKTDFDALKNFDYQELSHLNTLVNAKANYFHFSAGKSFLFLKYDVLFGVQYSISRQNNLEALANFSSSKDLNNNGVYQLEGTVQNNMNYKGDALTLFLGLTLKN